MPTAGDVVRVELPYSEVCMYMGIAGQERDVRIVGEDYPCAQVLNADGSEFSFPITLGEAGVRDA